MGLKTTLPAIAAGGQRKLPSWIDAFVERTANLESPTLFRKWSGITAISAVLEQKVWVKTTSELYPNIYVVIVGAPGTGKTRAIRAVKGYLHEVPDFRFAPISLTGAALVDALAEAKRFTIRLPDPPLEYNTLLIAPDEIGAFMHKYDDEMIALLSAFYDPDPYSQRRRGKDINITIKRPQVCILSGSTPSNLLHLMPEGAWDQGFTSRMMMIYSDEQIIGDDFADNELHLSADLIHDIKIINSLIGEFKVTEDYRKAVNNWRSLGEPPGVSHPKLIHYATRRRAHLYKLSMIAAVDRSNALLLTKEDFNRAMGWMLEAERTMPEIFKVGAVGADARAMDEIYNYVLLEAGEEGLPESALVRFAAERLPANSVMRALAIMEQSGRIKAIGFDKVTRQRRWKVEVTL